MKFRLKKEPPVEPDVEFGELPTTASQIVMNKLKKRPNEWGKVVLPDSYSGGWAQAAASGKHRTRHGDFEVTLRDGDLWARWVPLPEGNECLY